MENLGELLNQTGISVNFRSGGIGILVYILQALALYSIAKRRNIKKPWMAWIPVVNVWILGAVSDQYQYVVKGQVKNKRKVLLGLQIAMYASGLVMSIVLAVAIAPVIYTLLLGGKLQDVFNVLSYSIADHVMFWLLFILLAIGVCVIAVIMMVFFWMAAYDLFRSCDPKNSTLYLVLSIVCNFFVSGIYAVFMILCRDKDLGMPPRKVEAEAVVEPRVERDPWENVEE